MESIDLRASRYIIMDFNCTHRSTHHWSSMAMYGNFVKQKGAKFEFWVPKYIDREIEKELFSIAKGLKFLISLSTVLQISNNSQSHIWLQLLPKSILSPWPTNLL